MKSLSNYLIAESQNKVSLPGAYLMGDMLEFAANHNGYDEADEDEWDDAMGLDPEWAASHKPLMKKFCALCKKIWNNKNIGKTRVFLGNWGGFEDDEDPQYTIDEIGCKPGDKVFYYLTDGDNGEFYVMYWDANDKVAGKLIDQFMDMVEDGSGWDPQLTTAPTDDDDDE